MFNWPHSTPAECRSQGIDRSIIFHEYAGKKKSRLKNGNHVFIREAGNLLYRLFELAEKEGEST